MEVGAYCTPSSAGPAQERSPLACGQATAKPQAAACQASLFGPRTSQVLRVEQEDSLKKTFIAARNIIGIAGLLLAGYVIVTSLPDMGRYIKISQM
jgi:hypothetical protein